MSNNKKHMKDLHAEISTWKSDVALVRDELVTFKTELADIASKNSAGEVQKHVEHFQNQFIRQAEVSDELFHDLKLADNAMAEMAAGNPASDHVLLDDHTDLRAKAETYNKLFSELKTEYRAFLAKNF